MAAIFAALIGCGAPKTKSSSAPSAQSNGPHETWHAVYMQGSYVGYLHVTERTNSDTSPPLIESEAHMTMPMNRGGQQVSIETTHKSAETIDGNLVSFRDEQRLGPTPTVSTGQVKDGTLNIITTDGQHTSKRQIDLPKETGGPFAPEHSLSRQPMQPGESRTIRFFEPTSGALATETLVAGDYEQVELLSTKQELLRIESSLTIEGQPQPRSLRWTDRAGETLKTEVPGMQQVIYRTTKEQALREGIEEPAFDLLLATLVKLEKPIENARRTRVARYRVELADGDPAKIFAFGPTQHIKSLGPHTAEITVTTIDPKAPSCEDALASATAEDREANNIIQSDDPQVVEMARDASRGHTNAGEIAVALEEYVSRNMKRNYRVAFATAADAARTLEGDCTEHAVLLAALARASGIPARVAIGLVYSPADQAFAYHMWTEMLLDDCWVPLDATLGEGRISADHLKISDSALPGRASFLPVANVLGQLKIEVLDAR
ncbi:MAG: transglutaminase-like domain-containing protein [Pirellulales bacterium]